MKIHADGAECNMYYPFYNICTAEKQEICQSVDSEFFTMWNSTQREKGGVNKDKKM